MGIKWEADLRVGFEMEDGQPENLGDIVLTREVNQFQNSIERGVGIARTGVKPGSARVVIVSKYHSDA
jgi:hypothetical protein